MSLLSDMKRYMLGNVFSPAELARAYDTTKADARVRLQMLTDATYFRQIKHDAFVPNTDDHSSKEIAHAFVDEFEDLRTEGPEPISPHRFE